MSVHIEVPSEVELLQAVYFRGGSRRPEVPWLHRRVRAWVRRRVPEPLRGELLALLRGGRLDLCVVPRRAAPLPGRGLLQCTGLGVEEAAALDRATHAVLVGATEPPGATGVWLVVAAARAVARALDGVVLDSELSLVHPLDVRSEPIDPADLTAHWRVFASHQAGGLWLTGHGQRRLGLPPLEARQVPPAEMPAATALLGAVTEALAERAEPGAGFDAGDLALAGQQAAVVEVSWFEGFHGTRALRVHPAGRPDAELGDLFRAIAGDEEPVELDEKPPRLRRAIERGTAELPTVRERFARGLPQGAVLYLRVEFDAGATTESMWVAVDGWSDDRVRGRLANEPRLLEGKRLGDPVEAGADQLRDWAIEHRGGRLEGGRTMRYDLLAEDAA